MSKEPVVRKRTMYGGIGGGNSTEPRPVATKEKHTNDSAMVGQNVAGGSKAEKSQPRKNGDPETSPTQEEVNMVNGVSIEDLRSYLKEVGMTQRDFSRFTRTPYDTVRGWFRDQGTIRGSAVTVLVMLRRDKTLAATCRATGWEPLW